MSRTGEKKPAMDASTLASARVRVEEARERLGDTVGQLAAKADVKGRTIEKATEVKGKTLQKATEVKDRTAHMAAGLKGRTAERAAGVGTQLRDHTPERVRDVAQKAADTGRSHPRPALLTAAGAAALTALLVLYLRHRRTLA